MNNIKIGVFDSGIGGEALAASLRSHIPQADFMVVNDKEHVPYGDRSQEDVTRLTDAAIQPLLEAACDVIVIACNTATALAIETLRQRYPSVKFIGIEPMIKPAAALSKSRVIAVCATPATLASERYKRLLTRWGEDLTVLEPDCSQWAYMIEQNRQNELDIAGTIDEVCEKGADVVVLGCTHYHWIKQRIEEAARGRAAVIEPSEALARRVKALLQLP